MLVLRLLLEAVPLGKLNIQEGDIFIFPNCHFHKIDQINHSFRYPLKHRTILVFWLIDPDCPIISTKNVKEQYKYNPEFTLEKAFEHRLALMKERTAVKQSFSQHSLSLCEH